MDFLELSYFLDLVEGRGELTLDEKCDGPPFRDRSKYPKEIQEFFWPDDGTHEWWVRAVHNDQIFAAFYRGQRALLRDRRPSVVSGSDESRMKGTQVYRSKKNTSKNGVA
jgi:hypothetical protein